MGSEWISRIDCPAADGGKGEAWHWHGRVDRLDAGWVGWHGLRGDLEAGSWTLGSCQSGQGLEGFDAGRTGWVCFMENRWG